ncbi:MAG TPA: hypothetical protein VMT24_14795 [Aggregatilineaceae bacterium]|nr:hypothetical protein [Aggregatilineaceae bacterium]
MGDSQSVNLGFVVEVVEGDALDYKADVLAIKHAPQSGGLGAQVRQYLGEDAHLLPEADEYRIFPGRGVARAEVVLMVGAPPVTELRYPQLRALSRRFLEALWESGVSAEHMATTLHGVRTGAGLDEVEAFRSLLLGLADGYEEGHYPPTLKRITFVEKDENRVRVMQDALQKFLPAASSAPEPPPDAARSLNATTATGTMAVMAGPESFEPEFRKPEADETTPHVFVAMPFKDDYDDQYYLAIQPVVHGMGLLSERMDLDAFTGDIKARMLERIRTSRLTVALLDGGNPNVYLEVGYAWGVETPTILIAHEGELLPFDVRGERVLIYDRIYRLKQMLKAELERLLG